MSDETQPVSNADRFRLMADRIELNKDSGFGGACVIIPPSGAGDPIEILLLDHSADIAQFYSTVSTRIQRVVGEIEQQNQIATGFGRR
ncbi:MAG: hypothetical protein WA192_06275 [Candidatus Acidiferrales bacterium]